MTIKDINISIFQYVRTKQREFKRYWTLYVELFLARCVVLFWFFTVCTIAS
jgi:hypothetical protein